MCGITGLMPASSGSRPDAPATVEHMAAQLHTRGPDDFGVWQDLQGGVTLGHRRLAIVDLSPGGHQPMASACERYQIAFNGEIYNHLALRAELNQPSWRSHSDTLKPCWPPSPVGGWKKPCTNWWACLPLRCGTASCAR
jgi:asparagine synthase (glutamine-hydrolysing)